MHFRFAAAIALAHSFLSVASAKTYNVTVGMNDTNTYDPPTLSGITNKDTIRFLFVSGVHTTTQSTFEHPCVSKTGWDSGVRITSEWPMNLTNLTSGPLWFYCNVANHCKDGMVFALNPNSSQTFDAFQARARGDNSSSSSSIGSGAGSSTSKSSSTTSAGNPSPVQSSSTRSPSPSQTNSGIKISIHQLTVALAVAVFFARSSL